MCRGIFFSDKYQCPVTSVSYTHLDVYKRQLICSIEKQKNEMYKNVVNNAKTEVSSKRYQKGKKVSWYFARM